MDSKSLSHTRWNFGYEVAMFHSKLISKCEPFTSEDVGYAPFWAYLSEKNSDGSLRDILRYVEGTYCH